MKLELYKHAVITTDLPELGLKRGDLVTVVDALLATDGEPGYAVEVFNALGETLDVHMLPATALEPASDSSRTCQRGRDPLRASCRIGCVSDSRSSDIPIAVFLHGATSPTVAGTSSPGISSCGGRPLASSHSKIKIRHSSTVNQAHSAVSLLIQSPPSASAPQASRTANPA